MHNVIFGPVITEKTMDDVKKGLYTFKVAKWADKNQIREAFKEKFSADCASVATSQIKKRKRITMRKVLTEPAWKKATIKVKKGQTISLFKVEEKGKKKKEEKK